MRGGGGCGHEFANGAGIARSGVVDTNQEIARAVIEERGIQGEVHRVGKSAFPHFVVFSHGHHVGVALKVVFVHILHIHLDAIHGEYTVVHRMEE